ncbi:hypothetical protein STCU_12178 [Strigomonas culicis]|uniref:Uncharacterized protein n=1 Tax=Strigomonas culicis TaxID=28005 RepID=S9TB85_9TRYP|nr:hypothetical protein STCU_12178 [Strigomonas culicis]|eukprot:EPY15267.1 hypothetical protein STCU_12178 [Strigomonas culicis]
MAECHRYLFYVGAYQDVEGSYHMTEKREDAVLGVYLPAYWRDFRDRQIQIARNGSWPEGMFESTTTRAATPHEAVITPRVVNVTQHAQDQNRSEGSTDEGVTAANMQGDRSRSEGNSGVTRGPAASRNRRLHHESSGPNAGQRPPEGSSAPPPRTRYRGTDAETRHQTDEERRARNEGDDYEAEFYENEFEDRPDLILNDPVSPLNGVGRLAQGPAIGSLPTCPRYWTIFHGRPSHVPRLAWQFKKESTRNRHVRILEELRQMPEDLLDFQDMATAVMELLRRKAINARLSWPTIFRQMTDTSAALADLPIHTTERNPILLSESMVWRQGLALARYFNQVHTSIISKGACDCTFDIVYPICD